MPVPAYVYGDPRTDWKDDVRIASTANLGLTGLAAIDGVTPLVGDRILAKDQTAGQDNGIYEAASGAWVRTNDANQSAYVHCMLTVKVCEGTANAGTAWQLDTINPIVLGTTPLVFSQVVGGGSSITVEDEGTPLTTAVTLFDFAGAGVTVTEPTPDQVLVTIPGSAAGADLGTVQARRTTGYTVTSTFADVTFDATDVENDTAVVEHDNTNTDRVLLKETGLYEVTFGGWFDFTGAAAPFGIQARCRIDDTTVVPGSSTQTSATPRFGGTDPALARTFEYEATAGEYLTLQIQGYPTAPTTGTVDDLILTVQRKRGAQGATGATGPAGPAAESVQARRTTGYSVTGTWADITLDTTDVETDSAVVEHAVATDNVTAHSAGLYMLTYHAYWDYTDTGTAERGVQIRARVNDTTVIAGSSEQTSDNPRFGAVDPSIAASCVVVLSAADFVTLQAQAYPTTPTTGTLEGLTFTVTRLGA